MEDRLTTLIDDREHLARELHDCVLQALYAIGLNLEASRRMIPSSTPDLHRSSSNVVAQLNRLIQEVRGMIRSLESGTVQEFDLQAELRALAATYADAGHLRITTNISPDVVALLTHEEQREVLKILREAVSNSARHANAANVAISLHARGSTVRLHVCDDGIGFKNDESHPRGYGLANMAARAKKLGGRLRIRSRIGRGTRIVVEFALEPALPNS
jgi:signal transduction histidine kinase